MPTPVLRTAKKKSLTSAAPASAPAPAAPATEGDLAAAKEGLAGELEALKGEVRLKDTEIARLAREISDLQTLVQIESLRAELANLKALAAKK